MTSPTTLAAVTERWPAGAALALHLGGYVEVFGPDPQFAGGPADLIKYKCIVFPDSAFECSGSAPREDFVPLTPLARELLKLPKPDAPPIVRTTACAWCQGTGVSP